MPGSDHNGQPKPVASLAHKKTLEPGKRSSSVTGGTRNTPPARTLSSWSMPGG